MARISNGDEDRIREALEKEKQALVHENDQLRAGFESQRRRRKEVEREIKRARLTAEEAVQDRLQALQVERRLSPSLSHSSNWIALSESSEHNSSI